MLISFTLQNFRSFRDRYTLNLHVEQGDELAQNIAWSDKDKKIPVLRTAAIYGPNASGKSNLLRSMLYALQLILSSHKFDKNSGVPFYEPYLLDEKMAQEPTYFEIDFLVFGTRYRYSFSYTGQEIVSEEFAIYASNKEAVLYSRQQGQDINSMTLGGLLRGKRRKIAFMPNQLYFSVAANVEGGPAVIAEVWNVLNNYASINLDNLLLPWRTNFLLSNENGQHKLLRFLKAAGTGIESLSVEKNDEQLLSSMYNALNPYERLKMIEANKYKIRCGHINRQGGMTYFDLANESVGSARFLWLIGHIYYALLRGEVLVIDELNNSLHPQLAEFLVELFNDPEINANNAQLIFSTHDITLMNPAYMRRDQLFFVDKDADGASELYSLDAFNEVRKNTPFSKWYLQNRFQAMPDIDYSAIKDFMKAEVKNA